MCLGLLSRRMSCHTNILHRGWVWLKRAVAAAEYRARLPTVHIAQLQRTHLCVGAVLQQNSALSLRPDGERHRKMVGWGRHDVITGL